MKKLFFVFFIMFLTFGSLGNIESSMNQVHSISNVEASTYYNSEGSGVYADFKTVEGMFMGDLA